MAAAVWRCLLTHAGKYSSAHENIQHHSGLLMSWTVGLKGAEPASFYLVTAPMSSVRDMGATRHASCLLVGRGFR
jgi:hypothetical protein